MWCVFQKQSVIQDDFKDEAVRTTMIRRSADFDSSIYQDSDSASPLNPGKYHQQTHWPTVPTPRPCTTNNTNSLTLLFTNTEYWPTPLLAQICTYILLFLADAWNNGVPYLCAGILFLALGRKNGPIRCLEIITWLLWTIRENVSRKILDMPCPEVQGKFYWFSR